jgi:two-component system, cell cycle sensor histidine kinase and response regulator CckA
MDDCAEPSHGNLAPGAQTRNDSSRPARRQFVAISLLALAINLLFQLFLGLVPSIHPLVRGLLETMAVAICIVPFGYFYCLRRLSREGSVRFQRLADSIDAFIAYVNADSLRYEFVNAMYEKAFGIPRERIVGGLVKDVIGEENFRFAQRFIEEAKSGRSISYVNKFNTTQGERWVQVNYSPVLGAHGQVESIALLNYDITDRKHAEEALLDSQRQIEFILGATKTGLDIIDDQANVRYIDPQWSKIYGRWEGKKCWEYFQVGDVPCTHCGFQQALATKEVTVQERTLRKEGNRPVQVTSIPYQVKEGEWLVAEVTVDISQHKKAEEAQRENEILMETLMENLGAGVIIVDAATRVIERVNSTTAELFGTPAEMIQGKICHKFLCPAEINACPITDLHQQVDKSDRILLTVDGTSVPIIKSVKRVSIGGKDKLVETFIDISDRKLAEKALQDSEERFRSIVEQSMDGMFVTDEEGTIVEWNRAQEALTGLRKEDVLGMLAWDVQSKLVPADLKTPQLMEKIRTELKAFLHGERAWTAGKRERRIGLSDGSAKAVLESAFLVRKGEGHLGVSILSDITERKKAEDEKLRMEQYLQQAQRLESLGVLAGGIAHDFNNILMGVFGFTDLAKSQIKDETASEYLSQALKSMDRAKALTQQLLTFSKGGAPVKRISSIGQLVKETCGFALHGANVTCSLSISEDLWRCNVDKNQVGQVIENLMINAIQAMPMGGTIEVVARNVSLQERAHATLDEGNYVLVSIKDQGTGISSEMLPRIFDPFFTTKTQGHGLGLSIAYSIMNRHEGVINVQSELGKGTTFQLYFPACEESESDSPAGPRVKHVGTGRILVMDDDDAVRKLVTKMLESFGYSVTGKANGRDAVETFIAEAGKGNRFAAMILDLTIPGGIGGKEVAVEIRKTNKAIPLFVSSGYAGDPILANPNEYGFDAAISKPYKMSELMEVLERHMLK